MRKRTYLIFLSVALILLSLLAIQVFRTSKQPQAVLSLPDSPDGWDSVRMTKGLTATQVELTQAEQERIASLIWNYPYTHISESDLERLPVVYGGPLICVYFQYGSACYRWSFSSRSISVTTMLSEIPLSTSYFVADLELVDQLSLY